MAGISNKEKVDHGKKAGKKKGANSKKNKGKASFNWKQWLQKSAIASLFLLVFGGGLAFHIKASQIEHDLTVIGNGQATVVQVHDPGCQLCQRLKGNLDSVKGDFSDNIQFKTANIKTGAGREFADQHGVPHVTLLFFNERGQRVNVLQGVIPKEEIRSALKELVKERS